MKRHVKNYLEEHGYGIQDVIMCEDISDGCEGVAVDIHHIVPKSLGGTDEEDNLVAVCRACHQKRHGLQ